MLLNRSHNIVQAPCSVQWDAVVKLFEVLVGGFDLFGNDVVSIMQFVEHLNSLLFSYLILFCHKRSCVFIFALNALVWVSLRVLLLPYIQVRLIEGRPRLRLVYIRRSSSFELFFAFPTICSLLIIVVNVHQTIGVANNRIKVRLEGFRFYLIKI